MIDIDKESMLPQKLNGLDKAFIKIPRDIIRYDNQKLVLVYIFFSIKKGLDNEIDFTLENLIKWCGYSPNQHIGRVNDSFIESIFILRDLGYINLNVESISRKGTDFVTAIFNSDYLDKRIEQIKFEEDNDGLFAILYVDEIKKILSYKFSGASKYNNTATLFTAFSYLRSMIYMNSSTTPDYQPESYYEYYCDIATNIHMSAKTFSKLVSILYYDLQLIYYEPKRSKSDLTKSGYITLPTIFANIYCRRNGKLWKKGESYYLGEVEKKKKLMRKNFVVNIPLIQKKDTSCEENEFNKNNDWIELL